MRERHTHIRMLDSLLDQVRQSQCPGGLLTINGRSLPAPDALQKMFQFGVKRLDRRGAHFLDESVISVQKLAMVRGVPLMGATMDVKGVIEEIRLDEAGTAVGTEAADLAVTHLAGCETGHDAVVETEGGVHVVDRAF